MTQTAYFVPGLMCDHRLWQQVWPNLNNSLSPQHIHFNLHHNMPAMLNDMTQQLDLEPANLIGFSMGGYLSLRYAIEHPQAIKRLVIIGATGHNLTDKEQLLRDKIIHYVKANHYNGITKQRLSQFVHPSNLNGPVVETIKQMDKTLGKDTLIAQMEATAYRPSLLDQLHQLDFPVLVVGAEQDQLVKSEEIYHLAKQFGQADVAIIKDCGHMSPLEAAPELADILNQFLISG